MYCNKNIKSLLFDFRSDINYIMWLIISILKIFNCTNKKSSFKDYRKIGFIVRLIYNNKSLNDFVKFLNEEYLEICALQKLSACFLESKVEEKNINSALIILDKKEIINFNKTQKRVNIYSEKLESFSGMEQYRDSLELLLSVRKELYDIDYDYILKKINMLILEGKDA
ncbi:hypothetical protein [Clostridium thermobutyricum]|uniref:hypothetical protein n=1 Tax=Clostridium thermobutyricum TaxID=29372 RepID=UPI002941EF7A|nr:hypothetical protein [Clostridium thermobutyricum]